MRNSANINNPFSMRHPIPIIGFPALSTMLFALLLVAEAATGQVRDKSEFRISMMPNQSRLSTIAIQRAVDSCAALGGGTVQFPPGTYLTGGIHLKSNVTIRIEKGATVQGSDDYRDYGMPWKDSNALFSGDGLTNVTIEGGGTIDGVDCKSPEGEEGFRGPHCIRIVNSANVRFGGITIVRSANYAINCRSCAGITVRNVTIRGGHDGLHTRFCRDITVEDCDFRTGDDAFAGNDNQHYVVRRCQINTSCNGFRLGGQDVLIEQCRIWGPGEFKHINQRRTNTLAAFVYFSPADENPKLKSGNWLLRDVTVENVDNVFIYDYAGGLWQTGQPLTDIRFENLTVIDAKKAFTAIGDPARTFRLTILNSSFMNSKARPDTPSFKTESTLIDTRYVLSVRSFDQVKLRNLIFRNFPSKPLIELTAGKKVLIEEISTSPKTTAPLLSIKYVDNIIDK